jgi:hypothetical protein
MSGRQSAASAKERVEAANAETIKHLKAAVSLTEESKNLGSESAEYVAGTALRCSARLWYSAAISSIPVCNSLYSTPCAVSTPT